MEIGFVGLGQMGRPIAHNLMKSDARLTACARKEADLSDLIAKGAAGTTDAAALAGSDLVFLCLPNAAAVRDLLIGEAGLAPRLKPGSIVVDLGTTAHAATTEIAAALEARGLGFVDAPVSGMERRAVDGTLTVMCGGAPATFEAVRPLLDRIGSTILYMGPVGSGQLTKLINQLLFDINAAALAEILPMAAKMGLDPGRVGEVVNSGTGRSYASEFFVPRILRGHFTDGYPMRDAYKDLVSGAELGGRLCIPMPVLAAATATYQTALRQDHGDKDKGGMIRVFEDLLDVRFRSRDTGES